MGKPHALFVVGARPNYMKVAPALRALRDRGEVGCSLVHTGQHYDPAMSESFFEALQIPPPDHRLDVGSASHAVQTARIMERIEPVLLEVRPDIVIVAGDVNSTLAAALVASKLGIAVGHIEAGLRSYDRRMPEEINRVLVDQISDLLFTTERSAHSNLLREGIDEAQIRFVGNLMIDTLYGSLDRAVTAADQLSAQFGDAAARRIVDRYAVLTLHRPSNVDVSAVLSGLMDAVTTIARDIPVIFPVHPRTAERIESLGFAARLREHGVYCLPPVPYLHMVGLVRSAALVLTDSGGLQEETTALGIPCLTLRENTERPVTVSEGTNTVVGTLPTRIVDHARCILAETSPQRQKPEGWDGMAAVRLADHLTAWLQARCGNTG